MSYFICVNCCKKPSLNLKINIFTRNSYVHDIYALSALKTRHVQGSTSYTFWPFKNNVIASNFTITDFTAISPTFSEGEQIQLPRVPRRKCFTYKLFLNWSCTIDRTYPHIKSVYIHTPYYFSSSYNTQK